MRRIIHVDMDAFYASVEQRDRPELRGRPVAVGGPASSRGVVAAASYEARVFGVRSAIPMARAKRLCPDLVVVAPDFRKYRQVSQQVFAIFRSCTPLVEPLSLDEAFLDLTGTDRLHKCSPAQTLARLAKRIEDELAITVSVGLSFNKFLAKVASELDKPRGFSVVGRAEAVTFLERKPVTLLPGVGKAFATSLARDGIFTIGDVRRRNPKELGAHFGSSGLWLWRLSNADDTRTVEPRAAAKGISAETTFEHDVADADQLARILWSLCEKVSARAKAADLGGKVVQLKLKTADFKLVTRRHTLDGATQLARRLFDAGLDMLKAEAKGKRYRLIGIGIAELVPAGRCDDTDLFDKTGARRDAAERAMDKVREKFGSAAIRKGRSL